MFLLLSVDTKICDLMDYVFKQHKWENVNVCVYINILELMFKDSMGFRNTQ